MKKMMKNLYIHEIYTVYDEFIIFIMYYIKKYRTCFIDLFYFFFIFIENNKSDRVGVGQWATAHVNLKTP